MKKIGFALTSCIIATATLLAGCGGTPSSSSNNSSPASSSTSTPQKSSEPAKPAASGGGSDKALIIATGGTAGTYYPLGGGMATVWQEKIKGLSVTAQSTGGSVENLKLINKGDVDLALVQNDVASFAKSGTEVFKDKPQKFKAIAALYPEVIQVVVNANSDIKSIADLKGKSISVGSAGSGNEVDARMILKSYGITYDDIKPKYLSFAESADAFKNKQIDAFFVISGVPTPALQDITATNEIRILPIDGAGGDKLKKDYPFFVDHKVAANTYKGQSADANTVAVLAQLVVRDGLDENLTYNLTKTVFENLQELSTIHAKAKEFSVDKALKGLSGDLDPGAAKYYKEKGIMK